MGFFIERRIFLPAGFFLLQICILLYCTSAFGQEIEAKDTNWEITADRIVHQQKTENITAQGSVIIEQTGESEQESLAIEADLIQYDIKQETVQAEGNLNISAGEDIIKANEATVHLGKQTGTFKNATLFRAKNNLYLTGDIIEKTGAQSYHLEDSWLTTCKVSRTVTPPWSIKSADTKITKGGYAQLKHATFRIKKFPVFYLPYLIIPANQERKSGFLFPEYSQSERDGTGLIAPFFLNLSPSSDITFYPGYLTTRGVLAGIEFRYAADYRSKGTLAATYLHDSTFDTPAEDYKSDGHLRTENNRYWFRGKIDHDFEDNLIGHLDFDLVSDRDYLQEFRDGLIGFNKANDGFLKTFQRGLEAETIHLRENTAQLTKIWSYMDLNGELRAIADIRDEEITPTPLWSLPRISFDGTLPVQRTPLDLSWASEYMHYWRERGLGAHRLDLHPALLSPLPLGPYFESTIRVGLRETLYRVQIHGDSPPADWSGDRYHDRTLYDITTDIATTLVRNFEIKPKSTIPFIDGPGFLHHTVRPEIGYQHIPFVSQDELPLLDSIDRIAARGWLSYGILNNLTFTGINNGQNFSHNFGSLRISQIFDTREDLHPLSDYLFELNFFPFEGFHLIYDTALSIYGQGFTHYNLKANYANKHGDLFSVDYRYLQHEDNSEPYFYSESTKESVHMLNTSIESRLTNTISAKFYLQHSFATDRTVNSSLHLLYNPGCWSLETVASKLPDDFGVSVIFSLAEIGKALEFGIPEL